ETGLLSKWPEGGPPLAWQVEGLGGGHSSVAIADGRIFTIGERRGGAFLIALDQRDGRELWATRVGQGDPNATPTVDGELVYAIGRGGDLLCARAETGEEVWRKNFRQDFGGRMMSGWGYSESPLIDGDRLLCTPGAQSAMIAALDKQTGETIWTTPMRNLGDRGEDGAGYSSIVVSEAAGERQYVQIIGRGIIGVAADDGRLLWGYNRIANSTANIPTPIVEGDHVFCSTGYGAGAALLKIVRRGNRFNATEVYFLPGNELQNHHGGMTFLNGHVYMGHGHNHGFPVCINMKSGKFAWRGGRGPGSGSAAVLYADGHLYFRYQDGMMALIEATPRQYRLKGQFELPTDNGRHWAHPVIADGRLYLRDQGALLVYDIRE
ncbi:MAG: PQQ-binding-like beta-propeller repeat protein, partial [Planctomycetaceae bacterium]